MKLYYDINTIGRLENIASATRGPDVAGPRFLLRCIAGTIYVKTYDGTLDVTSSNGYPINATDTFPTVVYAGNLNQLQFIGAAGTDDLAYIAQT